MIPTQQDPSQRSGERRILGAAIAITGAIFFLELIGGIFSRSLALLSDAGHMITDLFSLCFSFGMLILSVRPATSRKTYGYYRLEILAALVNGALLVGLSIFILCEAVSRITHPVEIHSVRMLVIAVIGLIANGVCALLLSNKKENLNVRGAFIHVMGDLLSSVGIIGAAVIIVFTKWYIADPIVSIGIVGIILFVAVRLVMESVDILLESTPAAIKKEDVERLFAGIAEIQNVHDLHIWCISSGIFALSGHMVVAEENLRHSDSILRTVNQKLKSRYNIEHTTIQIESVVCNTV